MNKEPYKYSEAKTLELWLPAQVAIAIGETAKEDTSHLVIVQDEATTYYVNGNHVLTLGDKE